jgi:hypothetical protein
MFKTRRQQLGDMPQLEIQPVRQSMREATSPLSVVSSGKFEVYYPVELACTIGMICIGMISCRSF